MRCNNRCPTISATTVSGVWSELRDYYGPSMSADYRDELYGIDVGEFITWTIEKSPILLDPDPEHSDNSALFGRWFNWRLSIGTTDYGNLPQNKAKNHEGISCSPCPYDTKPTDMSQYEWDRRLNIWIGGAPEWAPISHVDSGKHYYLKIASRGNVWGLECTYPDCPYNDIYKCSYFRV